MVSWIKRLPSDEAAAYVDRFSTVKPIIDLQQSDQIRRETEGETKNTVPKNVAGILVLNSHPNQINPLSVMA
jgi:hypothetical protein